MLRFDENRIKGYSVILEYLTKRLHALSSLQRRLLLIALDAVLLPLTVWLSFWFRITQTYSSSFASSGISLIIAALCIGLPFYALSGQYKGLTRYAGSGVFYRLALRNACLVLLLFFFFSILGFQALPRSSWLLLWLLLTGLTGAVRFVLRDVLLNLNTRKHSELIKVAIYGAGSAGVQLAAALRLADTRSVTCFIDDDPALWDRTINGIFIKPPHYLSNCQSELDQILIAIPSLTRQRRREIINALEIYDVPVLQIPSVDEITSGRARIDALRPIQVEELLGRDPVPPISKLLGPGIRASSVCVTGAGGSIGSELCRQILKLKPKMLILFERSEPSLYAIHKELEAKISTDQELIPILGSASDESLVELCFKQYSVDIVFHAAAYKHVPLVEVNPLAGLANNVLSTMIICDAARRYSIRQVVLISTDKAVRPTNVMGASKRLAELVIQAQPLDSTRFSIVRFGNVLGSSGSVVPLFRRQIANGGPITLTHPEVIRYFMTITEAALLVIQSAVLAEGGDVFLLDMGDPVKIKSLAEQMIRLSGLTVRDSSSPNGDIEIICTGLRPGEKLYEELLIDAETETTIHPLIFRAQESFISNKILYSQLDNLKEALKSQDRDGALSILSKLVPEWTQYVET